MSGIGHFLAELRRRRVFRAAAVYAVGAWIVAQVATLSADAMGATARLSSATVVAGLLTGLPIVLLLAWHYDLTPDGVRRTDPVELKRRRLGLRTPDYLILAALAAMILAFGLGILDELAS